MCSILPTVCNQYLIFLSFVSCPSMLYLISYFFLMWSFFSLHNWFFCWVPCCVLSFSIYHFYFFAPRHTLDFIPPYPPSLYFTGLMLENSLSYP
ncbi:hypothetical protein BJ912DRAFT_942379 [Pholiota molesta]|nr:hypothetical protein BJ912DRAFT_942379 [Pholiota molesta]